MDEFVRLPYPVETKYGRDRETVINAWSASRVIALRKTPEWVTYFSCLGDFAERKKHTGRHLTIRQMGAFEEKHMFSIT